MICHVVIKVGKKTEKSIQQWNKRRRNTIQSEESIFLHAYIYIGYERKSTVGVRNQTEGAINVWNVHIPNNAIINLKSNLTLVQEPFECWETSHQKYTSGKNLGLKDQEGFKHNLSCNHGQNPWWILRKSKSFWTQIAKPGNIWECITK